MTEYALRLVNSADTAPRVRIGDALPLFPGADPINARGGVRPGTGGDVSVVAGGMTVQVTPFSGWVDGGNGTAQGGYPFVLDATKTLTIADGDASLSRTDTVVAQVQEDAFDASGVTAASVTVVQGTPGAGAPTLPATCVPLRDVTVPAGLSAGTGGLSSSNLGADRRAYAAALGGILPVSGAGERDALAELYEGMAVYRRDTTKVEVFDGAAWVPHKPDDGLRTEVGTATVGPFTAVDTEVGVAVTFAQPFPSVPTITLTLGNTQQPQNWYPVAFNNLTTTGFTIYGARRQFLGSSPVHWTATGPAN